VGTNPKVELLFRTAVVFAEKEAVLYGSVQQQKWAQKSRLFVARFLRQREDFSAEGRPYRREGTTAVEGTIFKVLIFSKAIQLYGLWHMDF
jgi:hypothetical protein